MCAANLDFVERYRTRAPLNEANPSTFHNNWLARRHQSAKSHGKRQPAQTASVLGPAMEALASRVYVQCRSARGTFPETLRLFRCRLRITTRLNRIGCQPGKADVPDVNARLSEVTPSAA